MDILSIGALESVATPFTEEEAEKLAEEFGIVLPGGAAAVRLLVPMVEAKNGKSFAPGDCILMRRKEADRMVEGGQAEDLTLAQLIGLKASA